MWRALSSRGTKQQEARVLTTDIPVSGPPLHQAVYAGVETVVTKFL
jgi:hypothetical protein